MKNFYKSAGLPVYVYKVEGAEPITIWSGLSGLHVVATRVQMSREVASSVSVALNGDIYVYTFGLQPGSFVISGMVKAEDCEDRDMTGLKGVIEEFEYRNAHATTVPQYVYMGGKALKAILLGVSAGREFTGAGMAEFSFNFMLV
jgi:hypothetical protein